MSSLPSTLLVAKPPPKPHLGAAEQERMAAKNGSRRTVYYTKQVPKGDKEKATLLGGEQAYARTHQYLGEWKDNMWEGKGTLEKADGSRYVGEWKAGKRHGMGTLWQRHADGSLRKIYAGYWADDAQAGRGTMHYANKDVYVGEWANGKREGVGICTYADGGVYEGEWLADKPHGFGVYDYTSGDHFEGLWVAGLKEGKGVHFYYDAAAKVHTKRYDGEWVDDVPKCGAYTEMLPDALVPSSQVQRRTRARRRTRRRSRRRTRRRTRTHRRHDARCTHAMMSHRCC